MIFYFLILVVFIAELIITVQIMNILLKLDKKIMNFNLLIYDLRPHIENLLETMHKLSEQILQLSPIFVNAIKSSINKFLINQLKNTIGGIVFVIVKKEVEKHVK